MTASSDFGARVLTWFDRHGRKDLPWQRDRDPYRIWVSEIMLQQTQVATVIPYFERFTARFPDCATLAAADLDEVMQHWAGLGYYSRARNLHRAARQMVADHRGGLPTELEALQALPGIGRSTAGAILALAFDAPEPILDGNVKRVLCRYHAIAEWPGRPPVERELWRLAEGHLPGSRIAAYTQAMMDLGATVCTRSRPDCGSCPLRADCRALEQDAVTRYPAARPRRVQPQRATTMLLLTDEARRILLVRRPPAGIWGGLWSLPEYPHDEDDYGMLRSWCLSELQCEVDGLAPWPPLQHSFTHFRLEIQPLHGHATPAPTGVMETPARLWYNLDQTTDLGVAAPVRRLLNRLNKDI